MAGCMAVSLHGGMAYGRDFMKAGPVFSTCSALLYSVAFAFLPEADHGN